MTENPACSKDNNLFQLETALQTFHFVEHKLHKKFAMKNYTQKKRSQIFLYSSNHL
jgi:hypothetical protein